MPGRSVPLPDHADVKVPPPLLYVALYLVGLILQRVAPLSPLPRAGTRPLAIICVLGWAGLVVWSVTHFRQARTSIIPIRPTTTLITGGPFRYTRNPLYLSFSLLYLGVALWLGSLWPILLLPFVIVLVQQMAIVREERYLERKFGDDYRAYRARVRRWL